MSNQILIDFDWKTYLELNKDLNNMNELEAKNHYEDYGYKENRKYKYKNIPDDFNPKEYIELNEDLQDMTDLEAKIHYENYGHKENRKYKYENISELSEYLEDITDLEAKIHYENIAEDFDSKVYIELNQDLRDMTDLEAKNHYEHTGYKENRKYKYENIPEDFDPIEYKILNMDLSHFDNFQLKNHYDNHGFKENRIYKLDLNFKRDYVLKYYINNNNFYSNIFKFLNPNLQNLNIFEIINFFNTSDKNFYFNKNNLYNQLPKYFCLTSYKKLNNDLINLNTEDLILHYLNHGKKENRKYLIYNNDNTDDLLLGNCVIFINHSSELTGGCVFLYNLVLYLQENNIFDNILVIDSHLNKNISELYYDKLKINPIYHLNNINLLNELLIYYNPIFIYSNSINLFITNIDFYPEYIINKSIFHFHEILKDVPQNIKFDIIKNNKIYFVSDEIRNNFINKYGLKNTYIFKRFY